jgi:hypothetical protein
MSGEDFPDVAAAPRNDNAKWMISLHGVEILLSAGFLAL